MQSNYLQQLKFGKPVDSLYVNSSYILQTNTQLLLKRYQVKILPSTFKIIHFMKLSARRIQKCIFGVSKGNKNIRHQILVHYDTSSERGL